MPDIIPSSKKKRFNRGVKATVETFFYLWIFSDACKYLAISPFSSVNSCLLVVIFSIKSTASFWIEWFPYDSSQSGDLINHQQARFQAGFLILNVDFLLL